MAKRNLNNVNSTMLPGWRYCVSISSGGFMSLSWTEHFFKEKEQADSFKKEAENQGYTTLVATPETY